MTMAEEEHATEPTLSLEDAIANLEREMIIDALKITWGIITLAAKILQATVKKFAYKSQKFGVNYMYYRLQP